MLKSLFIGLLLSLAVITGCSNDDDNPVNPPAGEVLLATVAGDSAGTSGGSSTRISSISSSALNTTDRSNLRITFYYSGNGNLSTNPMNIFYEQDTTDIIIFNANSLNFTTTEKYIDTTIASPGVNTFFRYSINALNLSGPAYIKFRELKIYKY